MDDIEKKCQKIRTALREYRLTNVWLVYELGRTGVTVRPERLCDILALRYNRQKTVEVVQASLEVIGRYERYYAAGSD